MKKIGGILVSLALALCLTGCNNSESSGTAITANDTITSRPAATSTGLAVTSSSAEENAASKSSPESSSEATESAPQSSAVSATTVVEESSSQSYASETAVPVETEPKTEAQTEPVTEKEKTLVVYFTWSSNTAGMAETIADLTRADTFEIVPVNPYPEEYTPCTEVALKERDDNARPAIENLPDSVSEYDNIIIGYPIWWHTAPMIIGTFLENYDLSGIDVYPFTQSASMNSEQFEQSMEFVRSCAGNGTVHEGLFARPSDGSAIASYLEQNGLTN